MYADQAAAKTDIRQSQIQGGFSSLEGVLEEAEKAVAMLVESVQPVSRSVLPKAEKDGPQAISALCPVAERIRRIQERVQHIVNVAHEARQRLEI